MLKKIFKHDDELEDFETYEEYEINSIDSGENQEKKFKKIINISFIVIMVIMAMISIDVVCVARYNIGPFFAIRTNVYKDGGTKVYYGPGYKVIKYHQHQGRRDKEIGFWSMPYSVEPTTTSALDLAIEFRNNPENTSKKYYKKFLRITGNLEKIDNTTKKITIGYTDPDGKYTFRVICPLADKKIELKPSDKKQLTVIGTAKKFTIKTKNQPNTLYMSDCFAE